MDPKGPERRRASQEPEGAARKRSWRELTRAPIHPALPQRANDHSLCFLVDLASGGRSPRLNLSSREVTLSLVLATRPRSQSFEKIAPLSVVPRAPFPAGAVGILCELAASSASPIVCLSRELCEELLPALCREKVLYGIRDGNLESAVCLTVSNAKSWCVRLEADESSGGEQEYIEFNGRIQRSTPLGEETLAPTRIEALLDVGFVVASGELARLEPDCVGWVAQLREGPISVLRRDLPEFLGALAALPSGPRVTNVEDVGFALRADKPQPILRLAAPMGTERVLRGTLVFSYRKGKVAESAADFEVGCEMRADALVDPVERLLLLRDYAEEAAVVERLGQAGFDVTVWEAGGTRCPFDVRVRFEDFVRSCEVLLEHGFRVELDGTLCRRARGFRAFVDTELDWFELKGAAHFDQHALELPELLDHVRQRERFVRLSDGTLGVMPEKWIADFDPLAALVNPKSLRIRFHALQALLVDGMLSSWSPTLDPGFSRMQARVRDFEGTQPLPEPPGFQGQLRGYQQSALGWLQALAELGLGGCLADDMGLGKTVVVLAWLLRRAQRSESERRASLLVVPKSLLFNWRLEAKAFAPGLKLLIHHGAEREAPSQHFHQYDVVLTSYGTLRRDAAELAGLQFDYVILDEAHTIKNEASLVHRSARRLSSAYRLALTGTPVENHLIELWSLMSFLNPGVCEQLEHLRRTFERGRPSEVALEQAVKKLVRPFILRRTKAEVATELPARIEKTLYVPLSGAQAAVYKELAEHYRAHILERRERRRFMGGASFGISHHNGHEAAQALEALLRLRQVACHPALLGGGEGILESPAARAATAEDASSAKLDLLLEQLAALVEEGHKALVFSQFTGFLGLVKKALTRHKIAFEYLDGQTTQREQVVSRFQTAPGPCVFLISLKTGGSGLNLTAADYVFILDPWWNPAAEAQAIDRAHRIGQTRPVIAYRLLAKGTVEAKVAALQAQKRALTDGLFSDEAAFSEKLTRKDLEYLLS